MWEENVSQEVWWEEVTSQLKQEAGMVAKRNLT